MKQIYGDVYSGNCYKLKLICALLNIEHNWIDVDILNRGTRTEEFLKLNPNGQIPVLLETDGRVFTESNSILYYLAQGSNLWPGSIEKQTRVLQWMFFEQYSHEPYIAVARFIKKYLNLPEERLGEFQSKQKGGHRALSIMEQTLASTPYLSGENLTIADISLFAYTHVAEEGDFDLSIYPAIKGWIQRIQKSSGFIAMGS